MVLTKSQMTEEDIKLRYITPAITAKWPVDHITMETQITDGRINIKGNVAMRGHAKKADYLLYLNDGNPIAVVEAKDNNHTVSYGMQQAKTYAQMMDLKFAYSSNGDAFQEYDFLTGKERKIQMDEFPSADELISRFKAESNGGQGLTKEEEKAINQPFYTSQNTYPPRYYQRNAVNRTLDAIAKGQDRILLAMATGTGKTYTAFQIVYRLLQTGMKKKVLYLADRNFLVDQSIAQDFSPLEKIIHKVNFAKDDKKTITSYVVYFALYQQMCGEVEGKEDDDAEQDNEKFKEYFSKDFFDLIIVDECHRGSAKRDSRWRNILEYFDSATQIGMTATPKETKYISNIDYFGEPLYTYSLKEGIDDGFLAPFKVYNIKTNISDGWRPLPGQLDINGNPIEDRIYNNSDYDYKIIIQDRTEAVAREITEYLKATDRMAKTIVFCPTEEAAERMRVALVNANSDKCKENPDYVVRITGSDEYGKGKLKYFMSVTSDYPVIATTSKLLSTGTDCKMVKLIVLDQMIGSMTEFKQIIGRGTRIREKEGKTNFAILDFRGVTRLFSDPGWDGPIRPDDGFGGGKPTSDPKPPIIDGGDMLPHVKPIVDSYGCRVEITNKIVSVYDTDGKLLRQENIIDYTKTNILGAYASLENFIRKWSEEEKKIRIREMFKEYGIDLEALKEDQKMGDVDDFDFICHVAFDQKPLTRRERANNVKKRDFLHRYGGVAREILEALLDRYMDYGITEIESTEILKLDPFRQYGKPSRIASAFGGRDKYFEAVKDLERELYQVG